ncbi:Kazal-type serine protease inhibitor like protein [Argiope bruennichi]|uniref:Kazal-type serine protease inhibitor like protein n=1 Tax=Argiope bruennichi TaxID=94029 RepID=A0A8T0FU46_ARGBR|nr:Kazal-type serine protease inhibitor like protein [Argiope bruennichi]
MWIPNQLVGAPLDKDVTLDCHTEAYPASINYWAKDGGDMIINDAKYETSIKEKNYKVHMRLAIKNLEPQDFGTYKCFAENSLGSTEGSIRLYEIPPPTSEPTKDTAAIRRQSVEDRKHFREKCLRCKLQRMPQMRKKGKRRLMGAAGMLPRNRNRKLECFAFLRQQTSSTRYFKVPKGISRYCTWPTVNPQPFHMHFFRPPFPLFEHGKYRASEEAAAAHEDHSQTSNRKRNRSGSEKVSEKSASGGFKTKDIFQVLILVLAVLLTIST